MVKMIIVYDTHDERIGRFMAARSDDTYLFKGGNESIRWQGEEHGYKTLREAISNLKRSFKVRRSDKIKLRKIKEYWSGIALAIFEPVGEKSK